MIIRLTKTLLKAIFKLKKLKRLILFSSDEKKRNWITEYIIYISLGCGVLVFNTHCVNL